MLEKSTGIIIRLTKLSNTSLIVRWWTLEHGMVDTVAKAARRAGSPFAGKIDLFYEAEIVWQRTKKGSLHTLRENTVLNYHPGLRSGYTETLLASYFSGLVEKLVEPEHPDLEFYDLLKRGLAHISSSGASLRAMRHFERETAKLMGVGKDSGDILHGLADLSSGMPIMRKSLLERLGQ